MSTFKKTIFLTNKESNNKGMAILTLQKQNKGIFCTIKSYNVAKSPHLILGLKCDNNIIKQNINLDNNIYNFLLTQEINLEKNLGCVLLDINNDNITPILWGSEKSENFKSQIVNNLKNTIQKLQSSPAMSSSKNSSTSNNSKQTQISPQYVSKENNEIHNENLNNQMSFIMSEDKAKNNIQNTSIKQDVTPIIPQKEEIAQAVEPSNLFETDENEIDNTIDQNLDNLKSTNPHKFYDMISEQLDELFERYPREENLENLVENSKWVKVKYEDQDKYYVVGLIYLNNDIKYICYGVPGDYYSEPPQHLKNYSQWLPTDPLSPYTKGFWVMYQDADSGENVLIN